MAARTQLPVGSAPWICAEKENVLQLFNQEKEELVYPAQHAMEWLNEHMAEIFSKSHFNVTDVFKTPGKVRGKTPRTARTRNALESRIPLSDIFSSQPHPAQSPQRSPIPQRPVPAFAIAQDDQEGGDSLKAQSIPKQYTDSGYHGSTEDEMEGMIRGPRSSGRLSASPEVVQDEHLNSVGSQPPRPRSVERRTTEGSFHSAREEVSATVSLAMPDKKGRDDNVTGQDAIIVESANQEAASDDRDEATSLRDMKPDQRPDLAQELDDIGSPSDGSTPDHQLVRKSSLTFASLPAREPLATKKSFGTRESRTSHLDQARLGRGSYFGRPGGLSNLAPNDLHRSVDHEMGDLDAQKEVNAVAAEMMDAQLHHKSSTQRLHEKIDMLGKSQASRLSRSVPSAAALAASNLRKSEAALKAEKETAAIQQATSATGFDEDDDWIKPLATTENDFRPALTQSYTTDILENIIDDKTDDGEEDEMEWDMRAPELIAHEERMRTPERMSPSPGKMMPGYGHTKATSTATLVSPGKAAMAPGPAHLKSISVSNPPHPSTTPKGSPRRIFDAPISASKSKLQSIMRTAKGLFTSSAGVSAAAKMETLSPNALRVAANNMPGLYPNITGMLEDKPLPPSPQKEGRKTRSSTEREREERKKDREIKDRQKVEEQLEKAREKEKDNAAQFKSEERIAQANAARPAQPLRKSPRRPAEEQQEVERQAESHGMPPPPLTSIQGKPQRPAKPAREMPPKNRPQPVSIRVGSTLSQRLPITTSALASNLHEVLPSTNTRQASVNKKVSNPPTNSAVSNIGFKSSVTSQPGKPRALLAAERKKEADEREAQRKLEQKRETERKRAAQQEEARRQEQKQRAEADRKERERIAAEQAKKTAQQQAIERRRQEQARKMEQQRTVNAANDLSIAPPRHEMGAARPPSRLVATSTLNRSLISHNLPTNPAKPPKRPHEEEAGPSSRPQASKYGAASQQVDAKRRRTGEEETIEPVSRPTMSGAPIRQSNMGKKPSIFSHGYAAAPNAAPNMTQPQNPLAQFAQPPPPNRIGHPNEMSKYANGNKIPFADAPNPPAHPHPQPHHKTPSHHHHPPLPKSTLQLIKSSPQYTPGDTIALPEIPTDSEDSCDDSSDEAGGGGGSSFPVPSWASPTTLTNQLMAQESIDGDAVFGPIAPLRMEEIFAKGNKDRLKRFRDRTSSANWALSGDGLTLEEVRADREMRERMRVQGGWRYGSGG